MRKTAMGKGTPLAMAESRELVVEKIYFSSSFFRFWVKST